MEGSCLKVCELSSCGTAFRDGLGLKPPVALGKAPPARVWPGMVTVRAGAAGTVVNDDGLIPLEMLCPAGGDASTDVVTPRFIPVWMLCAAPEGCDKRFTVEEGTERRVAESAVAAVP